MKKLILIFISLFYLLACEENKIPFIDKEIKANVSDYHIPLDEALNHLDSFLNEMNMTTKSSGVLRSYSDDSIETISKTDIFAETKSDAFNNLEMEDLMYIVNFDDNKGTAILSADERTEDIILCVTESGSLSLADFMEAYNFMLSENAEMIGCDNEDDFTKDLGDLTVPSILLSSIINDIQNYNGQQTKPLTKSLSDAQKYGPWLTTKWCQDILIEKTEPLFNKYTPHNYPAGCVVIAVAQILLNTSNFTFTCSDGHVCKSDTMLTVATNSNPDYEGTDEAKAQVGKFVYELGESNVLCDVSYAADGSSSNANKAARTFEAFLMLNVDKKSGFNDKDETNITNMIRAGKPVYMSGLKKGEINGHAWVVDGEWGDYYHINWGWNGLYDGYFAKGTFKPQNRENYKDDVDRNTYYYYATNSLSSYTWSYKYITYD